MSFLLYNDLKYLNVCIKMCYSCGLLIDLLFNLWQVTELTPCETENPMGGRNHCFASWSKMLIYYYYIIIMVNVAVPIILFACGDITHLLKTCSVINSQFWSTCSGISIVCQEKVLILWYTIYGINMYLASRVFSWYTLYSHTNLLVRLCTKKNTSDK